MTSPSISSLESAIDAYERSLSRSNAGAIEEQLEKSVEDLRENAKREAYLAIVRMCEYLNSWAGAADRDFLISVERDLADVQGRIERNPELQPFAYLVAYGRGFVFRGLGRHNEAFAEFAKSGELNRDFFRADSQKAAQKIYLDDLPAAEFMIKEAIRKTPKDSPAFPNETWTLARIKFFRGEYKAAIALLEESMRLDCDRWYTFAYQCSAYSYIGRKEDAERLLGVLRDNFQIYSLQDVIDREKLNPTARSKAVEEGRRGLHGGLVKAGLPCSRPAIDRMEALNICTRYRQSVEAGDRGAFRDLWTDNEPRLVVAYGSENFGFEEERHVGKVDLEELIFGGTDYLENPRLTNERMVMIADGPAAFIWQFHLEIRAKAGDDVFDNDLLVRITTENLKIKEFLEFGDPRKRGALFRYLAEQKKGSHRPGSPHPRS